MAELTRHEIERLLRMLEEELGAAGVVGELYLVGGAVMCLVYDARPSTRDVDGWFRPAQDVRAAAERVAERADVRKDWLNDAVKGFLSPRGEFEPWLELPNLKVFVPDPAYLLALKCVAMRIGPGHRDVDDVRYLLRHLDVTTAKQALEIVTRYFDEPQVPVKTRLALEELLGR